jgi:hypothetical protein
MRAERLSNVGEEICKLATPRTSRLRSAVDKRALIENFVVQQITLHGQVPARDTLVRKFSVSDTELDEIDSQYRVLRQLWAFNEKRLLLFLNKVAESEPKPADLQGLMYLIAQTEIDDALKGLKGESL